MKTFYRLSFALVLCLAFACGLSGQTVYVATGSNGVAGTLYQINSTNGDLISSVPITNASGGGAVGITGLAFNPLNGTLYGVTVRDTTSAGSGGNTVGSSLVTINTTTGLATVIGSFGTSQAIGDIAFASNGTLYGWEARSPNSLATINLSTAALTTIGNSGLATTTGGGLAFNSSGTLYLSATGATGTLDTVNRTTGAVTTGPTLTGAPNDFGGVQNNGSINALAFNSSGVLYGANSDQQLPASVELVTINLVNGAVTDLFTLPDNTDAIAFNLTAVPEPSTVALLVGGAITAAAARVYRRRR